MEHEILQRTNEIKELIQNEIHTIEDFNNSKDYLLHRIEEIEELVINKEREFYRQYMMKRHIERNTSFIDVDKANIGDYSWIVDYLEGEQNNPELISRDILELAKKKCNGRVLDDMTIVVSKLYSC